MKRLVKTVKCLHITDGDRKFIPQFKEFISENFCGKNHRFVVYSRFSERKIDGFEFFKLNSLFSYLKIRKSINNSDKIILHGLLDFHLVFNLLFMPKKKSFFWLVWGGDLYCYYKRNSSTKEYVRYLVRKFLISRVGNIITYYDDEVINAKKWFSFNGNSFQCLLYTSNILNNTPPKPNFSKVSTFTIQVGNSGYPANNHEMIFKKIKSLEKDSSVRIFCPLAYGNDEYIKSIVGTGRKLFGEDFSYLSSLVEYRKYLDLIHNCDIAVFDSNRQQAVGNIIPLLGAGKTIFMRLEIEPAKTFLKLGFHLFNSANFELKILDERKVEENMQLSERYFSRNALIDQYASIGLE